MTQPKNGKHQNTEKEFYRREIIGMVEKIDNLIFLRQIWTIINRHVKNGGD